MTFKKVAITDSETDDEAKDMKSNTKTNPGMETEADPEGQSGKANLIKANYAKTDSEVNDDSGHDIKDDLEEADNRTDSETDDEVQDMEAKDAENDSKAKDDSIAAITAADYR